MTPNLHIYPSPELLAEALADKLITFFDQHTAPVFHVAISGGKTPNLLFTILAGKYAHLPIWKNIHFWWVDERMVPFEDDESNYGTAHKLLFSRIDIPEENIHPIKGENDPTAEALSYSHQISNSLPFSNGWPVFDLILLGMGDDGHTASIFPNQMQLLHSDQICKVAVYPQSGQKRITLTGPTINSALNIWFIVTGTAKADRLKEIFSGNEPAKSIPAANIMPLNGTLEWYVDKAAAGK
ncbi:MAG: 6-phosphogluconolactonase [Candidatus Saccharibacteria bacterium]